jgi:preprotein translocase subunit YajC
MLSMMFSILAQEQQGGNPLVAFLPLILIGGVFYFLLIRPQQRRAKAQQALVRSAEVGDEIVTTSGIFGTILDIDEDDDVLIVEIAPGTRIRMVRAGIGRRITEDDEYEEYDEGEDEDGDHGVDPDLDPDDPRGDDEDGSGEQQGPIQQL